MNESGESKQQYSECVAPPGIDDPIRQGDVLRLRDNWGFPYIYGVVVTADCDIVQWKHGGYLSYVPILPLRFYLENVLMPGRLERGVLSLFRKIHVDAAKLQEHFLRDEYPIALNAQTMKIWLDSKTADEILSALVPSGAANDEMKKDRKRLHDRIDVYRAVSGIAPDGDVVDVLKAVYCLETTTSTLPEDSTKLDRVLQESGRNLPGDAFFLSSVHVEEDRGYVAYLRWLRELPLDHTATTWDKLQRNAKYTAARVARLTSPFVYRLTQQLAEVFASIGLPKLYEDSRDGVFETVKCESSRE